jgi:hypothetical protein
MLAMAPPLLVTLLATAVSAPKPHVFTASSWQKPSACDPNKSKSAPPAWYDVDGIEPMNFLGDMKGETSAGCLLNGGPGSAPACLEWDNGTAAMAAGRRVVRLGFMDRLGTPHSAPLGPTDLPPLWIGEAIATLANQSARFFAQYHRLGGQLDELVQDSEEYTGAIFFATPGFMLLRSESGGPATTNPKALAKYGSADNITKTLRRGWLQIQRDVRFPPLLAELKSLGLAVNDSDPEYLASAMLPFSEGALQQAQLPRAQGGNINRAIWNAWFMERRSKAWAAAFLAPARKYFPAAAASNYQFSRSKVQAGEHCTTKGFGPYATLNCLAGPGASGYPLQAPSAYLPLIRYVTRDVDTPGNLLYCVAA